MSVCSSSRLWFSGRRDLITRVHTGGSSEAWAVGAGVVKQAFLVQTYRLRSKETEGQEVE